MNEQTNQEFDAKKIALRILRTDWYYWFSDYIATEKRGQQQEKETLEILNSLSEDQLDAVWAEIKDHVNHYCYHFRRIFGEKFFLKHVPVKLVQGWSNKEIEDVAYLSKDRLTEALATQHILSGTYGSKIDNKEKQVLYWPSLARNKELEEACIEFLKQNGWAIWQKQK